MTKKSIRITTWVEQLKGIVTTIDDEQNIRGIVVMKGLDQGEENMMRSNNCKRFKPKKEDEQEHDEE